ncbi:ESX secretion-associated protein EspG [Pseudonocardia endophytica]|uniref:ESAT-6 protein secretion system EspG family protein n=1 Tax=Pseudonocardia endophytica TaxID=401976 RepID=A0A4R1I375_PSEEN|nr:ESX secretion-associated protein EspG [Pseudonocardia endophytica]TCK27780.1 ESAT-6 protein secretion system EspG family protein [Pseudonocardia endophytica]
MAVDWARSVVLSVDEFDVAWELLDLGDTPAALELRRRGRTYAERDRIVAGAIGTLRARGLVRGSAPVPALAADLTTLAGAGTVRDLVVSAPVRLAAVAATEDPNCVLAARLDQRVALARIAPGRASAELVGLIGAVRPGHGPAVRIPADVLSDAAAASDGDRDRFTSELMRRGVDGPDAVAVLRMGELTGAGQLGATHLGRRATHPLLVHVTDHGVYRQRRVPRAGVETVVEAGPVDAAALTHELDELVAGAGPGAR